MSKMSLKSKIIFYITAIPVLSFAIICVLTIMNMRDLKEFAFDCSKDLAENVAKESMSVLEKESRRELKMLSQGQAMITSLQLQRIDAEVTNIACLYKLIYNGVYTAENNRFTEAFSTKFIFDDSFSYFTLPAGVSIKSIEPDIMRMSMLRNAFKCLCVFNEYTSGIGIAQPDGLFFKFSWFPIPQDFDPRGRIWYKQAIKNPDKNIWTGPYIAIDSNRKVLSCSRAVQVDDKIVAVVCVDVRPRAISEDFIVTLGTGGFGFIIDQNGKLIAKERNIDKQLLWNVPQRVKQNFETEMSKLKLPDSKFRTISFMGEPIEFYLTPLNMTNWTVGIAMPRNLITEKARRSGHNIRDENLIYSFYMDRNIQSKLLLYIASGIFIISLILLCSLYIAKRFCIPIMKLEQGAERIGKGKLDEKLYIKSGDELQDLAETFNKMSAELKGRIRDFKENLTIREQIDRELNVAAKIQRSILPDNFPAFPDRDEIEVYAEMKPAREVGGDFYDFFFIDNKHLFFTIGDVSGKGLPAALFMVRALTLLRHEALENSPPDKILSSVGNELEKNNHSCMFITGICGILDTETGEMLLANAGHNPPFIRKRKKIETLELPTGMIIGALPLTNGEITIKSYKLEKGDTLFLYTDGITEAFNKDGAQFGVDRLKAILQRFAGANPHEVVNAVSTAVNDFVDKAPQSDDITMLTIKYYG
ncbi:SpoIIE family protein phosphatase [Lentisphaerota bacterium ZTH]|nr:SpoIIE family protein phosphatase [Lentisphaerota bacterium]WET07684.1 SpoIIE family protein phosphatase [Lentisphaerota bacterium ZTH]